jgi:hypothetical protein
MEGAEWQENLEKQQRIWRNFVKNPKQATRFDTFFIRGFNHCFGQ